MSKRKTFSVIAVIVLAAVFILVAAFNPLPFNEKATADYLSDAKFTEAGSASTLYDLSVNEETLALRVTDKATGETVLQSDNIAPDTEEYDNGLNTTWEKTAYSAVTIYYTNEKIYKPLVDFSGVEINLSSTSDGFSARVKVTEIGLIFTLKVSLDDDGLTVSIPGDSVTENKVAKYPLVSINVYPFMNATRGIRQDGFILVPDGSGAVIDLTRKTLARNPYSARVYGDDYGTSGVVTMAQYGDTPPVTAGYPVFGLADEGKGFTGIITSGAEYSRISAYASGITTDYNFVYPGFIYRESFYMPVDNKGTTITALQEERNSFDAEIRYDILKEATLGSMAAAYRDSLIERGMLPERISGGSAPMKADFLMADNYDDSFGIKTVCATDTAFVQSAFKELADAGVSSVVSGLIGYSKNGVTGAQPKHFPVGSSGSKADYENLSKYAAENNVLLMPVTDYLKAYNGDYTKAGASYSQKDLAMSLGKKILSVRNYKQQTENDDDFLLLHPKASAEYFKDDLKEISDIGFGGIQLDSLGYMLSSSTGNLTVSRSQTIQYYRDMAESASFPLAIERPSEYLYKYADYFVNAPMSGSQYMIALNNVPFIQMALSGYTVFYSGYVNLNKSSDDVISLIEYNVYPAYVFTEKSAYELNRTLSGWVYSSQFDLIKDEAVATYKSVDSALSRVKGALFVDYYTTDNGLKVCVYDNGVSIAVNHGDAEAEFAGQTVKPQGFVVTESEL